MRVSVTSRPSTIISSTPLFRNPDCSYELIGMSRRREAPTSLNLWIELRADQHRSGAGFSSQLTKNSFNPKVFYPRLKSKGESPVDKGHKGSICGRRRTRTPSRANKPASGHCTKSARASRRGLAFRVPPIWHGGVVCGWRRASAVAVGSGLGTVLPAGHNFWLRGDSRVVWRLGTGPLHGRHELPCPPLAHYRT